VPLALVVVPFSFAAASALALVVVTALVAAAAPVAAKGSFAEEKGLDRRGDVGEFPDELPPAFPLLVGGGFLCWFALVFHQAAPVRTLLQYI
jgi:hypothetical protein